MIGPALMRLVILHYHIFKNAGATILDILDHSFGERFAMLDTPVYEAVIPNPDLLRFLDARPGLCAVTSHQIRHPLPEAPGCLFFDICFLRDPIDRIRSIYTYFRQKPVPADPISDLANRAALGDFVAGMIRDFPLFVKNVQVNLLACAGDSDEPEPRDLDLAIQRMLATSFLGVVDCFDQSVVAGAYALRRAFPELDCDRPPVNVSGGLQGTVASRTERLRQACAKEVYEELLRLNALDRQLVERARAEVLRRFRQATQRAAQPVQREKRRAQAPGGFFTRARRFVSLAPYWRELSGSARKTLFDADYYRTSSTDESAGSSHPLLHFLVQGAYQGRQPHPLFDPAFYLRKYPDVAAAGANPLCHYLKHGAAQLRQPHPLFDPGFYLGRNPDIRRAGMNPLVHYVRHGAAEDRKPLPLFEPSHYRNSCAEAPGRGQNLLAHFLGSGAAAASPHPLFDCEAYLDAHPDAAAQGGNPLVHYLLSDAAHPAGPAPAGPPGVESAAIAHLDIQDARVIVVCLARSLLDSGTPEERRAIHEAWKSWARGQGMSGSVALVWPDACGLAQWLAEPQQQPFLAAVRLDQIRAQAHPVPAA
jgi:hypothetical protein